MAKTDRKKLQMWQERLGKAQSAYEDVLAEMDEREQIYRGEHDLHPQIKHQQVMATTHVRNIASELVEAQVDSTIPQPKVTPRRKQDEGKAKIIEDLLRNELDRLPMEVINDLQERIVPIQGGSLYLTEWDNTQHTHQTVGELTVTALHPKTVIPQDGVRDIEDMDYVFVKIPQTKEFIRRRYGVDVEDEGESEADIRGAGESAPAADLVTQYSAYYRNEDGGIGLFAWMGGTETVLEDLEDYQARRLRRCKRCGQPEPPEDIKPLSEPTLDGTPGGEPVRREKGVCPYCGSTEWDDGTEEYEEIWQAILRSDGSVVAEPETVMTEMGVDVLGMPIVQVDQQPIRVPYYKPNVYPIVLQRNVSVFGQFLGESDIDKIRDQQNSVNRIEEKIVEKITKSGSYLTLPPQADVRNDDRDMKLIVLESPADAQMIGVYTLEGDVTQDLNVLEQFYQEARQIIGVTDSFQGRKDSTATSGKAKEFAAAQSAGRLESKRRMKDAAYANLFEIMFKFLLAYADEPREVSTTDIHGNRIYEVFNKWDFLERDETGEFWWNDLFLFSCDSSAPLASNREAMWQETRLNLQTGAFGNPQDPRTLILFWTKMEQLHYPGAGETKAYLEQMLQQQMQQQQMQMQMQAIQQARQDAMADAERMAPLQEAQARADQENAARAAINQARQDAARDAGVQL